MLDSARMQGERTCEYLVALICLSLIVPHHHNRKGRIVKSHDEPPFADLLGGKIQRDKFCRLYPPFFILSHPGFRIAAHAASLHSAAWCRPQDLAGLCDCRLFRAIAGNRVTALEVAPEGPNDRMAFLGVYEFKPLLRIGV
jgi:hypothetical protein